MKLRQGVLGQAQLVDYVLRDVGSHTLGGREVSYKIRFILFDISVY